MIAGCEDNARTCDGNAQACDDNAQTITATGFTPLFLVALLCGFCAIMFEMVMEYGSQNVEIFHDSRVFDALLLFTGLYYYIVTYYRRRHITLTALGMSMVEKDREVTFVAWKDVNAITMSFTGSFVDFRGHDGKRLTCVTFDWMRSGKKLKELFRAATQLHRPAMMGMTSEL